MILYRLLSYLADIECERKSHADASNGAVCPACHCIRDGVYPKPIEARVRGRGRAAFTYAPGIGTGIFRTDLLDVLRPALRGAVLGPVRTVGGERVDLLVTCYVPPEHRLFVRSVGGRTRYGPCKTCGRFLRLDWTGGSDFVIERDLAGADVRQDDGGFLYVSEHLAAGIDWTPWPDIRFEPIDVLVWPPDRKRLPWDPEWDDISTGPMWLPGLRSGAAVVELRPGDESDPAIILEPDPGWVAETLRRWLCGACGQVDYTRLVNNAAEIVIQRPPMTVEEDLFRIDGAPIWVFHRRLIEQFGPRLAGVQLVPVRVRGEDTIAELVACFLPAAARVRLLTRPVVTCCEACRRPLPVSGSGPRVLVLERGSPEVLQDAEGRLVLIGGAVEAMRNYPWGAAAPMPMAIQPHDGV